MRSDKLRARSIAELKALITTAQDVIDQKTAAPDERDIALEHSGEPELIAEVLETRKRGPGRIKELRKVYCSPGRCLRCPHGPYWYSIRENKRRRTRAVRCTGAPVFSQELIETIRQQARPPVAVLDLSSALAKAKAHTGSGGSD